MAAECNIDILLAYGSDARAYVSSAKENGLEQAYYFDDKQSLSERLLELTEDGDAVLFKGSRGMKLEDVINFVYKRWEK